MSFRAPNLVSTPRRTRTRASHPATTTTTIVPVCTKLGLVRIFRRLGWLPPKPSPRAVSRFRAPPKRSALKRESKYATPVQETQYPTILPERNDNVGDFKLVEFSYSYFPRSSFPRKVTNALGLAEPRYIHCVKGRLFEVVAPEEFAAAPLACEVELDLESPLEKSDDDEGVIQVLRFDLPADSPKCSLDNDAPVVEREEEMDDPSWMEFIR